MFDTPKFCIIIVFSFSWELKWPQEKLKTMLMQNFGVTNKEHYGMLWYFLEWSIVTLAARSSFWHKIYFNFELNLSLFVMIKSKLHGGLKT